MFNLTICNIFDAISCSYSPFLSNAKYEIMNVSVKSPVTPRRVYYSSRNICVICEFAFVQTEVTATGQQIERKLTNTKLKLSSELVLTIKKTSN